MISEMERRIKEHSKNILFSTENMPEGPCEKCSKRPELFSLHERRSRCFRFIVDSLVQTLVSYLLRWKCPLCEGTFTVYPSFALPYKRYVRDDIERLSRKYLEEAEQAYRKVLIEGKAQIGYPMREGERKERYLDPSTIWRWVGFWGAMEKAKSRAVEFIKQKAPDWPILGKPLPIAPHRYRSEQRKRIIQRAQTLLRADPGLKDIYGYSNFPRFATPFRWC